MSVKLIDRIPSQLTRLIAASPDGLSCSQVCRAVNGVDMATCYNCRDYGNMWKRRRGILVKPPCQIRKGRVWYRLQKLEKAGILRSQREKRSDGKMTRGWDYMRIYYMVN